jgi:hypothetical protein
VGDPPIRSAFGGCGVGDPPIIIFGGCGVGDPPIASKLCRNELAAATTENANTNVSA